MKRLLAALISLSVIYSLPLKADVLDRTDAEVLRYACQWIRSLPSDGQALGSRHVTPNQTYILLNSAGGRHVTVFIGKRIPTVGGSQFLHWLASHVNTVAHSFRNNGLRWYAMVATEEVEVAVQGWESPERMNAAFQSSQGKTIVEDASRYMDTRFFGTLGDFRDQFRCL